MERKKNIIYITGVDTYGVETETRRFIDAFRMRQDAEGVDMYHIEDIRDWNKIIQDTQTMSLFGTKRLFVFYGVLKIQEDETFDIEISDSTEEKKNLRKSEDILLDLCKTIYDDTFIIFSGVKIPAKSWLSKWLYENVDIRDFWDIWTEKVWEKRYPNLETDIIETLLRRYKTLIWDDTDGSESFASEISLSLEKLSLIRESRLIKDEDFDESLFLKWSGKMFDLSDAVFRWDAKRSLSIFRNIIEKVNIYAFIASFLWLIRPSMYVRLLKEYGKTRKEVESIIKAHPFVIQKAYESRISHDKLTWFYQKIISLNTAYRSGKGKKNAELWLIFDIELAIMGLKK